jgi:hypothetical protein
MASISADIDHLTTELCHKIETKSERNAFVMSKLPYGDAYMHLSKHANSHYNTFGSLSLKGSF